MTGGGGTGGGSSCRSRSSRSSGGGCVGHLGFRLNRPEGRERERKGGR